MQKLAFEFNGQHELLLPDGGSCRECAEDIITGKSYPWPRGEYPSCVVDIGAHAGEYTVCAAALWPGSIVHAYEPHPTTFGLLQQNTEKFKNVVRHNAAVRGAGWTKTDLILSSLNSLCHSVLPRDTSGKTAIQVDAVGGDIIQSLKPDILKIDAEGVELEILQALNLKTIYRIYLEFHYEEDRVKIMRLLDETHALAHAHIWSINQGELMYVRRGG